MSDQNNMQAGNPGQQGISIGLTSRLSLMMFVQYFIWGAWATTLGNYMGTIDMGESIPTAYSFGPISATIAPFFLGMVADRFLAGGCRFFDQIPFYRKNLADSLIFIVVC